MMASWRDSPVSDTGCVPKALLVARETEMSKTQVSTRERLIGLLRRKKPRELQAHRSASREEYQVRLRNHLQGSSLQVPAEMPDGQVAPPPCSRKEWTLPTCQKVCWCCQLHTQRPWASSRIKCVSFSKLLPLPSQTQLRGPCSSAESV